MCVVVVLSDIPCVQSTVDEAGLTAIDNAAQLCKESVDAGNWQQATNRYRLTQTAVSLNSNFVDFYNILKFNVIGGTSSEGQGRYDVQRHSGMPGRAAIHGDAPHFLGYCRNPHWPLTTCWLLT